MIFTIDTANLNDTSKLSVANFLAWLEFNIERGEDLIFTKCTDNEGKEGMSLIVDRPVHNHITKDQFNELTKDEVAGENCETKDNGINAEEPSKIEKITDEYFSKYGALQSDNTKGNSTGENDLKQYWSGKTVYQMN